jgi:Tfp pilus assembly protein PilF
MAGAEACYLELLSSTEKPHFASVPAGLRGYRTRHNLATIYKSQGRLVQAEEQWRLAVEAEPGYVPGWLGLEDVYVAQGQWDGLEYVARRLERLPNGGVDAATSRARGHLARHEFAAALRMLEQTIATAPDALRPRLLLSHVYLQEGRDLAAAERALRDVLALDPEHAEAKQNLHVLLQQLNRNR